MNPVVAVIVAVAVGGLLLGVVDLVTSPTRRRLAVRSMTRRRGEASLVVLGAMFGTAIIGTALIVGDSFDRSIRDVARTELGPVDILVTARPDADVRRTALRLEDRVAHSPVDHVDGVLPYVEGAVVLDNGRRGERQSIDRSCLLEVDTTAARRFGPDPISGLDDVRTPDGDEAVVSEETSTVMGVGRGDTLVAHLYGQDLRLRVREVVPTVGLAGYCGALVSPGTLDEAWAAAPRDANGATTARGPGAGVFVSLDGGLFDSTTHSDTAVEQLRAAVEDAGFGEVEVAPIKQRRLESAERSGSQLRSIFSGIGGFSVVSGILLLVNLVIMLAEERTTEFGLLRAVGFRRSAVLRAFALEGMLYAAAAAVTGAVASIGVGALVVKGTQSIFSDPGSSRQIRLFVEPPTLALAAAIGFAISIVTVWIASTRVARLNIVSAIRDLPPPRRRRRHPGRIAAVMLLVVAAVGASVAGVSQGAQIPLLAGVPIAALLSIVLVSQLTSPTGRWTRAVMFAGPAVAIVWTLGVFTVFEEETQHAGIAVFVAMGLLLVSAAVVAAIAYAPVWGHLAAGRTGSLALSSRLGLAYPLAHRVRTGLILAMFSLVVFTMVFMACLAATIDDQAGSTADDLRAGYDVIVDANSSTPVSAERLQRVDGVDDVVTFLSAGPQFAIRYRTEPTRWGITGFDEGLLRYGTPALSARLPRFGSDRAAFEAVLADPSWIIVDDAFLLRGGGPKTDGPEPGDTVTIYDLAGDTRRLTVAGVLKTDAIFFGSLWPRTAVAEFLSPATVQSRAFLRATPGTSRAGVEALARTLAADTLTDGTEVATFENRVAEEFADTTAFMRLLQGYLALGLLIGIAGLGVVMVRAARERRHEVGTLRALGFPSKVVARAFLIEALFVATGGVLIGTVLAVVTSYQVVVNSDAFSLASDGFTIPWVQLAIVAVAPTVFALLAAARPALTVARIRPAVALRIPD